MSDTENIILIDWLCFTTKDTDVEKMIRFLGLERLNFVECGGYYGYKTAKQFGGIWIMYDGGRNENAGLCVEMSGQGCRQYETSGLYSLAFLCDFLAKHSDTYHITRLDVAFDDVDHEGRGLLNMKDIEYYAREDLYVSRFRSKSAEWSSKHSDTDDKYPLAYSVYFGSAQSNTRFRLYDKALERGGLDYHWTRFEIQLRQESCLPFLLDEHNIGEKFYGLINNNLRFVMRSPFDSNRRRWRSPLWWEDFLQSALKISVFTKKNVDYNMSKLENYLFGQAGKSLYTFLCCKGSSELIRYIKESMTDKELNDNQLKLIAEYADEKEQKLSRYYKNQPKGLFENSRKHKGGEE